MEVFYFSLQTCFIHFRHIHCTSKLYKLSMLTDVSRDSCKKDKVPV